jgi:hypothetical protein
MQGWSSKLPRTADVPQSEASCWTSTFVSHKLGKEECTTSRFLVADFLHPKKAYTVFLLVLSYSASNIIGREGRREGERKEGRKEGNRDFNLVLRSS